MNDLDRLKALPDPVDPLDDEARERIRRLLDAKSAPRARRSRRVKIGVFGVAAVLAIGSAAAAATLHLWTKGDPVAIPLSPTPAGYLGAVISDPNGKITNPDELASAVAEFAPAIRLPEGGSFDQWRQYVSARPASDLLWKSTERNWVVGGMVYVSECQWAQQWLNASSSGDQQAASQAITVLGDVGAWEQAAYGGDSSWGSFFLDQMRNGDRTGVQMRENGGCAFMGAWGTTPAQEDAKATGDLAAALPTAQEYLRDGGDPAAFDRPKAASLAPNIYWTSPELQPVPDLPGGIFIPSQGGSGIVLVSPSESGTRFCAVVTTDGVVKGTTTTDLTSGGPITCQPGGW